MECCSNKNNRANRSDVHLSAEEETKIEKETRDYFDTVVPKRHTKPQRSEHSNQQYVDVLSASTDSIPELTEFQRLEHDDPQKLVYSGSKVTEEFVETEYYKDLNCVDKQHHTTGTGFIKMENSKVESFALAPDTDSDPSSHFSSHGNPATNEWTPAPPDMVSCASDKPKRSEN